MSRAPHTLAHTHLVLCQCILCLLSVSLAALHTNTHTLTHANSVRSQHVGKSARLLIEDLFRYARASVCVCTSCYVIMMMGIACRCCYSSYSSSNSSEVKKKSYSILQIDVLRMRRTYNSFVFTLLLYSVI